MSGLEPDFPEYRALTLDEAIRQIEARILIRLERTNSVNWSIADVTAVKIILTELKRLRE